MGLESWLSHGRGVEDFPLTYLSDFEISKIGLGTVGQRCQIDETVIFLFPERIDVGDEVRIDAFSIINAGEGEIRLADKVHLASHVRLIGGGGIHFGLGSGASSGVCVYSQSDDFTEGFLAHPTVPIELRRISRARIEIGSLAIIGPNSVLLPGASMETGSVLGALSLLKRRVPRLEVFAGVPARKIKRRDEDSFLSHAAKLGQ